MPENAVTRTLTVLNRQGIHARTAAAIATLLRTFKARVTLAKDNNRAEGTEVLQILSLCSFQGDQLAVEATGADAPQAVDALEKLFLEKFGEE